MITDVVQPPADYRLAGAMILAAGALDLAVSSLFVLSLGIVCVGFAFVVPLAVALGEMTVGILAVAGVPMRFARTAAVVGVVNASLLFDAPAVLLQVLALVWLNRETSRAFVALPGPPKASG